MDEEVAIGHFKLQPQLQHGLLEGSNLLMQSPNAQSEPKWQQSEPNLDLRPTLVSLRNELCKHSSYHESLHASKA